MWFKKVLLGSIIITSSFGSKSFAVSDTNVERTITVTVDGQPANLSSEKHYVLIDPVSGALQGEFVEDAKIKPGFLVVDKATGQLIALSSPSGRIVDIRTVRASDPLFSSIDNRRGELNRQITAYLSDGKITEQQAKILRDELDKIGARQSQDTSFGKLLSYSEAVSLSLALNDVAAHLSFLTHDESMKPLISSRLGTDGNNAIAMLDDVDERKAKLRTEVDDEYIAGKLMFPEVESIKGKINQISDKQIEYRRSGVMDAGKKAELVAQLDKIQAEIDQKATHK